mgnify:CR=1 FL=1
MQDRSWPEAACKLHFPKAGIRKATGSIVGITNEQVVFRVRADAEGKRHRLCLRGSEFFVCFLLQVLSIALWRPIAVPRTRFRLGALLFQVAHGTMRACA